MPSIRTSERAEKSVSSTSLLLPVRGILRNIISLSLSFIALTITAGAVMLFPAAIVEYLAGRRINPTPAAFAVLAYVAIFPSLVAYVCFNRGVELIGANRAGPFFHLMPVFGSIIAIAFLGERPELFHGLGYALIVGGIFVAQIGARRGTAMPAAVSEGDTRSSAPSPG